MARPLGSKKPTPKKMSVCGFQVFEYDAMNWAIHPSGKPDALGYYPTVGDALEAVFSKAVGKTNTRELAGILTAIQKARADILTAVA